MKILQYILILTAVAVDATNTRRLRRGTTPEVNSKYLDLDSHIDETTKDRVARHQIHESAHLEHEERHLVDRELQSMSMSMSMSMMSMSMSMSMDMRRHLQENNMDMRRHLQEDDMSMSMSMSMRMMSLSMSL